MPQPSPATTARVAPSSIPAPADDSSPSGMALVLAGWTLWSLDPVMVSLIGDDVPRALLVGINLTLGGLALFRHIVCLAGRLPSLGRATAIRVLIQSVLFTGCASLLYVTAIRLMHPGLVSAVLRTQVAFAVVGAMLLLGERMHRLSLVGMGVIFAGNGILLVGALFGAGVGEESALGWTLAILASLLMTGGTLNGKVLLQNVRPAELTGVRMFVGGGTMLALALALHGGEAVAALSGRQWLLLAIKGIGTSAAGFVLYYHGLKRVRVYVASAIETAAPLMTIAAAWLFLRRPVPLNELPAVAVLLGGTALVVVGSMRARRYRRQLAAQAKRSATGDNQP